MTLAEIEEKYQNKTYGYDEPSLLLVGRSWFDFIEKNFPGDKRIWNNAKIVLGEGLPEDFIEFYYDSLARTDVHSLEREAHRERY